MKCQDLLVDFVAVVVLFAVSAVSAAVVAAAAVVIDFSVLIFQDH